MTLTYQFGRFELRPTTRQHLVDEQPATLGARAFDLLLALVERHDRVVSAEELVELVWVQLGSDSLADLHGMTKLVLRELHMRLATGPLSHSATVPFFHYYSGKMQRDTI